MRKNLFNSAKKLAFLALCLFTFNAQSADLSTAGGPTSPLATTQSAVFPSSFAYNPISGVPGAAFPMNDTNNKSIPFASPGNVVIQFDANTKNNIYVELYAYPVTNYVRWQQSGSYYQVKIDPSQTDILCFNEAKKTTLTPNTSSKVTPGVTQTWWISVTNSNTLTVGQGTYPNGTKATWTIPAEFVIPVTYLGFGGAGAPTTYTNISVKNPADTTPVATTNPITTTSATSPSQIWGVNKEDKIWYRTAIDTANPFGTDWKQTDGLLKQISVGPNGQVWGVNAGDQIWYRSGIDATNPFGTGWKQVDGLLKQISVGPDGQVWGVNASDVIYYRTGIDATNKFGTGWKQADGLLKYISVGPNGQIWGVNKDDKIFYRTGIDAAHPFGTGWQNVAGGLMQISVGPNGQIWGVNKDNQIWYRTGIDATNTFGTGWKNVDGGLKQISVGPNGQIWGVNAGDLIYYRTGINAANPFGTGWTNVPGGLKYIAVGSQTVAGATSPIAGKDEIIGVVSVGDSVKIESTEKPGYFLADDGTGKSLLTNDLTKNINWVLKREGSADGTAITSGTFPKLMNKTTGKYLSGTGSPMIMGTTEYASGEFWTPVNIELNNPADVDTLVATFRATRYPEQYTYVLYKGLAGDGDGKTFTTPTPAPGGGYQAGYVTQGIVPKINTTVLYDKKIAFVSNGGSILSNTPNAVANISNNNSNMWYIRPETASIKAISDFPADYVVITPKENLDSVTVGSKDGKLEIWALDSNEKPYRFNELAGAPYTIPDATIDPWELQTLKDETGKDIPGLEDIFATCDGNLFGIRSDDKTAVKYDFTKKQWARIKITNAAKIKLENISASKGTEIFASSEDDTIYKLENNAWKKLTTGSFIAAGIGTDGKSIVIGISKTGVPYKFASNKWTPMGTEQLSKIAIGNQNHILGITLDDKLVKWDGKTSKWLDIPGKKEKKIGSVDDVAAIPSGTTVALDKFGNTYHKGSDAVTITAKGVISTKATTTTVTTAVATKQIKAAATKKSVKATSKKAAKKITKKKLKKTVSKKSVKPVAKKPVIKTFEKPATTTAPATTPAATTATSNVVQKNAPM